MDADCRLPTSPPPAIYTNSRLSITGMLGLPKRCARFAHEICHTECFYGGHSTRARPDDSDRLNCCSAMTIIFTRTSSAVRCAADRGTIPQPSATSSVTSLSLKWAAIVFFVNVFSKEDEQGGTRTGYVESGPILTDEHHASPRRWFA